MPDDPDDRRHRPSGQWQEGLRDAGPYLGLGMQLAFTMVLFTVGGYFLDQWLETLPWLTVAGAVVGMVSVFVYIVRVSQRLSSTSAARRKSGRRDAGTWKASVSGSSGSTVDPYGSTPDSGLLAGAGRNELSSSLARATDIGEDLSALEREFARLGEVKEGKLLLPAWDALSMIEAARKEQVPVLGLNTFVPTEAGMRPVDAMDFSAEGVGAEGWDVAAQLVSDLRDSGLRFEVVLGKTN